MTQMTSTASDYILKSFNALNPTVAQEPTRILDHLSDYRTSEVSNNIQPAAGSARFEGTTVIGTNLENSYKAVAASVGIKGSYGVYSGSAQLSVADKVWQSAYSFSSVYSGSIDWGSVSLKRPDDKDNIARLLDPEVINALNAIQSYDDARSFTNTYGTHVITGVALGGRLSIINTATATSITTLTEIKASVSAKYSAIEEVSAAVSASKEAREENQKYDYKFQVKTIGGNPSLAAQIENGDFDSLKEWSASCTSESVRGISTSMELWELADGRPRDILRDYIRWSLLINSLNDPTLFTEVVAMEVGKLMICEAKAAEGFKVLGGGAAVTAGSSCFLTGSYPGAMGGAGVNPISWIAEAHDLNHPAEDAELSSYCLAIYDPEDLITLHVKTVTGDLAEGKIRLSSAQPPYLTVGGGVQVNLNDGYPRFLTASYPDATGWSGESKDYQHVSTNGTQTVSGIAIDLTGASLAAAIGPSDSKKGRFGSENKRISASLNRPVTYGGVHLERNDGPGNLLQQSFPSSGRDWTGANKDQDYESYAEANIHAFHVEFTPSRSS